jgi:hypothetical protein
MDVQSDWRVCRVERFSKRYASRESPKARGARRAKEMRVLNSILNEWYMRLRLRLS